MITLHRDTLTFTFPESGAEMRSLIERRIKHVAAELPPPWHRDGLLYQIESHRNFHQLEPAQQEASRIKIKTWTPTDIESVLREFAFNRSGPGTDLFTSLSVKFERTTRLLDNDCAYVLPTGLGQLPLRSVDDFPETAPMSWIEKGGVVLPLYRSEALWIWFSSPYRFAVKIRIGEIDALSGVPWSSGLQRQPQNYLVAPNAPWEEDDEVVRRLVMMPLCAQEANGDGIQFEISPIHVESVYRDENTFHLPRTIQEFFVNIIFAPMVHEQLEEINRRHQREETEYAFQKSTESSLVTGRQKIADDPYQLDQWNQAQTVRCFVHVCDPPSWRRIMGANLPYAPLTATDYLNAHIPWFDNYEDDSKKFHENLRGTSDRIVQPMHTHRPSEIRGCLGSA